MENRETGVEEVKSNLDKRQEIIQDIIKGASNSFEHLRETHCSYYYTIIYIYVSLHTNAHTHTHTPVNPYTHTYMRIYVCACVYIMNV